MYHFDVYLIIFALLSMVTVVCRGVYNYVCDCAQGNVTAVPVDSWSVHYVAPRFVCLQRDQRSVFLSHSQSLSQSCLDQSVISVNHFNPANQPPILQALYGSTCGSWHLLLKMGGFCWCKVLLPACPC